MIAAMVNHLWQSTAFGLGIALLTFFMRRSSAGLRFWLWLAASMKFLVPFAILSMIGHWLAPAAHPGLALRLISLAAEPLAELTSSGPMVKAADLEPIFDPTLWLCGVWGAGLACILGFWFLKWLKVDAIVRSSQPLPWIGPLPVKMSSSVCEPWLVGIWRPVVLLPATMVQHFQSDQIDAILAHEACHRRRSDNLWAGLHMSVAALFWFHPMVWWIGARLIVERERACDDAVVRAGYSREVYARAILETCRQYFRSPLACVSGASGTDLTRRVEVIMLAPAAQPATSREKGILLAAGLAAVAVPLLAGLLALPSASASAPSLSGWFYNGPTPDQIAHDLADQKRPRTSTPYDPARFDRYVGEYQLAPYSIMTVTRRGDRFFTQLTGQDAGELYPEGGERFFYKVVPAQISFVTKPTGQTTALILHQNGFNMRLPKLERAAAAVLRATLARRIAENQPSPGTEVYVRNWLTSVAADRPDYSGMAPQLALAAREQWLAVRAKFHPYGQLKAVRFLRVSPQGADLYEADFETGRMFLRIAPLERGKVPALFMRPMS